MAESDIRELKAKVSEIVHEVRQHQARYVVTHRGELLLPFAELSEVTNPASEYAADAWEDLQELGEQITERWTSAKTSIELLSEMRR